MCVFEDEVIRQSHKRTRQGLMNIGLAYCENVQKCSLNRYYEGSESDL